MKIQELSSETWNDFVSLMSTDSQCTECWCLNHREPAGCPTGSAANHRVSQMSGQFIVYLCETVLGGKGSRRI
jgi:hypothetical protein